MLDYEREVAPSPHVAWGGLCEGTRDLQAYVSACAEQAPCLRIRALSFLVPKLFCLQRTRKAWHVLCAMLAREGSGQAPGLGRAFPSDSRRQRVRRLTVFACTQGAPDDIASDLLLDLRAARRGWRMRASTSSRPAVPADAQPTRSPLPPLSTPVRVMRPDTDFRVGLTCCRIPCVA